MLKMSVLFDACSDVRRRQKEMHAFHSNLFSPVSRQMNASPLKVSLRLVPSGGSLTTASSSSSNGTLAVSNSARRLDVLRSCIANIFDNKISDAKKTFPSVMSTLKTRQARLVLVEELAARKASTQVRRKTLKF